MRKGQVFRRVAGSLAFSFMLFTTAPATDAQGEVDNVTHEIGNLKDPERSIRENAAHTLAEMNDPRVVEPLVAALKDPDSQVRVAVVFALGS